MINTSNQLLFFIQLYILLYHEKGLE